MRLVLTAALLLAAFVADAGVGSMGVGVLMGPGVQGAGSAPPVDTFYILTEAGDRITTEASDPLVTEAAL